MNPRRSLAMVALLVVVLPGTLSCKRETPVELFVDGFEPENVRFEVEDLGAITDDKLTEIQHRGDIDGTLRLPASTCDGPCRAAIVSVFVHNHSEAQAPPVVRLKAPTGKPERLPIGFRGKQLDQGRIGRVRWIVQMYPDETSLTATLSASVFLVPDPTVPKVPPTAPPAAAIPDGGT